MTHRKPFPPARSAPIGVLVCGLLLTGLEAPADSWPVYQKDNRRSGVTGERLALPMQQAWVKASPLPPQTAWTAPAKWDAYAGNDGLQSMRNFDPALFTTTVGEDLFYGSSIDHAVHCLDTRSGEERWAFFTGGPIRLPPAWADGKVYFGSDDGHAYCLDAATGDLVWKHSPVPASRLIPSDGKLISMWPVRTGVLVADGVAYFAGSLLPWEPSYLCAVDAASGEVRYTRKQQGVTLQGAILASETLLYVPQGRSTPLRFSRVDGKRLPDVAGSGGVFCILTPEDQLVAGPASQKAPDDLIRITAPEKKDAVVSFPGTNRILISGEHAYLHQGNQLTAVNRARLQEVNQAEKPDPAAVDACYEWKVPHEQVPVGYILSGDVLFSGTDGQVTAYEADTGCALWEAEVDGRAYGLAAADGALYVSTDRGSIYCFRGVP